MPSGTSTSRKRRSRELIASTAETGLGRVPREQPLDICDTSPQVALDLIAVQRGSLLDSAHCLQFSCQRRLALFLSLERSHQRLDGVAPLDRFNKPLFLRFDEGRTEILRPFRVCEP